MTEKTIPEIIIDALTKGRQRKEASEKMLNNSRNKKLLVDLLSEIKDNGKSPEKGNGLKTKNQISLCEEKTLLSNKIMSNKKS